MPHKIKTDQKGFSLVESLLVIIAVAVVAFVGYYVYHTNQQSQAKLEAANKSTESSNHKSTKPIDPTAGWKTYTSEEGKFTVKYPNDWSSPSHPDFCGDFLKTDLETGPNDRSVISCGADGQVSEVSVQALMGDKTQDPAYMLQASDYADITKSAVTVDGVSGQLLTGKSLSPSGTVESALPDGTLVQEYVFLHNGMTYIARYTQLPLGGSGAQDTFTTMVTKTLKFEE